QQSEFMEALEKVWRQKQSDKLSDAKNLQVQIAELEDTKSRLVIEMVSCDESLKNDIKSEIENLKIKIARLQSQVADLKSLEDDMAQFVEFGLNYTDNLIDDWWDLDYETRLWCQQLIFPGGITFNSQKKVGTPFLSPIYTLQANKKAPENASDALVVELAGIEPASVGLFN
ncbi:MAG TPA: hypothetical protein VLE51_03430, partial [Candidatus Saccharimonadales bacterium]|nr:hypothetical protein [Candidatus Saccharimonadales bacterium]